MQHCCTFLYIHLFFLLYFTDTSPTSKSTAPTEQFIAVEDLEEGQETLTVDMSEAVQDPSDNEGEDVDGQIRAFVKFPDTFPDIAWDEIEA